MEIFKIVLIELSRIEINPMTRSLRNYPMVLIELSRIEINEINLPTHEKRRY